MLLTAGLFILIGVLIKNFKRYNLIAGYNTMPAEKKATYNIEKIATLFRNVFFSMAIVIVIGYILTKFTGNPLFENSSFYTAMIIGIPYLLIKSNSKLYKL
ncbi:MAG: DUF3784 domain-containing protein [Flavobacteriaceae bacterium]